MAFGSLPAYQGGNALNFQPITNALSDVAQTNQNYARMAQQQQSIDLEKQRTASELQTQGLQRKGLEQQQAKQQAEYHGGIAQAIINAPPDQQAAMGQRYIAAHPELQQHIINNGFDPSDVKGWATSMRDEALGPQNPLDVQSKQLGIKQAEQNYETGKYIKASPGDQFLNAKTGQMVEQPGGNVVTSLADAIESGKQPPTFNNMGRGGLPAAVKSELQRRGVDVSNLENQWTRAQAQIKSLNGPQLTRYVGLTDSVDKTIDRVNELAEQMKQSGIPALNKASLFALTQTKGNSPEGQLATQYLTGINMLKEEFANLAQGGNAPTEPAWELANQQINGNYGTQQLGASLGEVQRLIRYRKNFIPGINTLGPGAPNRYAQSPDGQPPPAAHGAAPPATAGQPAGPPSGDYVYDPATKSLRPK